MTPTRRLAFVLFVVAGLVGAGPAHATPRRVVSINLCADQLVLLLAEPQRILSVSHLARDPSLSFMAAAAEGMPVNHGSVEEVIPLAPDLVVAGSYTARPTVAMLKAKGVPVIELTLPADFDQIRAQVRRVAAALDAAERGEALIDAMDRTLASTALPSGPRPAALAWQAGGFTAGAGTLTDAVLRAAGLDNLAARMGLTGYGYLTLETVVAAHPDLLIAEDALPDRPSLRQGLLQHPALRHGVGRRVSIPPALWACGAPFTAEAVRLLGAAAAR